MKAIIFGLLLSAVGGIGIKGCESSPTQAVTVVVGGPTPTPSPTPTPEPCFPSGAVCSSNAQCCGAKAGETGACVVDPATGQGACR